MQLSRRIGQLWYITVSDKDQKYELCRLQPLTEDKTIYLDICIAFAPKADDSNKESYCKAWFVLTLCYCVRPMNKAKQ